jgi:4-amino-4-deoxy-L-arabinose transferase-like glycosyltransferase
MNLALTFIGVPVVIYLILAALPRGRAALIGIGVAALIAALVWVRQSANDDSLTVATATLAFAAIALAGLVQILRSAIGVGRPRWVYPLIVLLGLVGAGLPLINVLGG